MTDWVHYSVVKDGLLILTPIFDVTKMEKELGWKRVQLSDDEYARLRRNGSLLKYSDEQPHCAACGHQHEHPGRCREGNVRETIERLLSTPAGQRLPRDAAE